MKHLFILLISLLPVYAFAQSFIYDFEWLEPDNRVEAVVGEPHQLQYSCSNPGLPFTDDFSGSWVHYDFEPFQHVVDPPTGYSIDEHGVITGLIPGSYAIKFTGWILAKNGANKWLYITVVSERKESESNNSFETANEVYSKIRFGLYNITDVDYFKFEHDKLKSGDEVTFKIHYYGTRENPFGYKWSMFTGTNMTGGGSLIMQDQQCSTYALAGKPVYFEVYYNQSYSQYFNYGEEFAAEVYINGIPASEYGKDKEYDVNGDGEVNIADINAIIDFILDQSLIDASKADVNHDSEVNIADINAIIDKILGS